MQHVRRWMIAPMVLGMLAASALGSARAAAFESPPEGSDVEAIVRRADRALRGERTNFEGTITYQSPSGKAKRTLGFRAFDDRLADRSFLRIEPHGGAAGESEPGTTFLNLPPNVWQFDPDAEETTRLVGDALRRPLLDSAFGIDGLLDVASLTDDYEHELLGIDPHPAGLADRRAFVVAYVRRTPESRLWPRILAWIDAEWGTPLRHEYFDGSREPVRVVDFGGVRPVAGRNFPHVWSAWTEDPKRMTRIDIDGVVFDTDIDAEIFTPRHLKATR